MRICSTSLPTACHTWGHRLKTREKKLLRIRDNDVPIYLDALVDNFPWERWRL